MGKHKLSSRLSTLTRVTCLSISAKQRRDLIIQVSSGPYHYHCVPSHYIHCLSSATPLSHSQLHELRKALVEPCDHPDLLTRSGS